MNSKTFSMNLIGVINPIVSSKTTPRTNYKKKNVIAPKSKGVIAKPSARRLPLLKPKFWYLSLPNLKLKTNLVVSVMVVCSVLSFAAYIYQVNSNAALGYELQKEQKTLHQLTEENKKLLFKTATSGSIVSMEEAAKKLGLVPITNQEFLNRPELSQK